ncbi:hypothetical protein H072_6457 [Dactylellina haptotyla CBS 200.50]|uniref:F-box domain-containing protein n=1 Tax=Dactylellina haptotyla (strain CBS 200.50) TaxID=1284197 RepID=S8BK63_DACHA|nr:hypothetical protein H072_6457 [Dactylellina haptotyla CBS 200.50]
MASTVQAGEQNQTTTISTTTTATTKPVAAFKLLDLPADIFQLILQRLTLRDIIALSLSAKSLRHIYKRNKKDRFERFCSTKIHTKFLGPYRKHEPCSSTYKCPYCSHPLCPPSCKSALFLDSSCGIFFPPSLWDVREARFAYGDRAYLRRPTWETPSFSREYSTVWCEHHRCPRDLFSMKKFHKRSRSDQFLKEYFKGGLWGLTWEEARSRRAQSHKSARWFVGYKTKSSEHLASLLTKEDSNDLNSLECHEKKFFETFCRHCFQPLQDILHLYRRPMGGRPCYKFHHPRLLESGCDNCGVVTIRFTWVDVFDQSRTQNKTRQVFDAAWPAARFMNRSKKKAATRQDLPEEYLLLLATECRVVRSFDAVETQRLRPIDPAGAETALSVVRGRSIVNVPPPRIGIQDLPYKVLALILDYLRADWEDESWFNALTASYCFLKASQRMHPKAGRPYTAKEVWRESYS